jgi:hypothetical protein
VVEDDFIIAMELELILVALMQDRDAPGAEAL